LSKHCFLRGVSSIGVAEKRPPKLPSYIDDCPSWTDDWEDEEAAVSTGLVGITPGVDVEAIEDAWEQEAISVVADLEAKQKRPGGHGQMQAGRCHQRSGRNVKTSSNEETSSADIPRLSQGVQQPLLCERCRLPRHNTSWLLKFGVVVCNECKYNTPSATDKRRRTKAGAEIENFLFLPQTVF
jgi:hypothetical protein